MKENFINALEDNNLIEMRKIPKSDLHNHGTRGGNIKYIEDWAGKKISRPVSKFKDLHEMQQWNNQNIAPEVIFIPEIGFGTGIPLDEMAELLELFLVRDYFKSIDMYGDEYALPAYKKIFRRAKTNGLILKAHVGEFGNAELVRKVAEELELDQVQHGIAAAESQSIMKWLSDNRIQLNICPASNILLGRVENYNVHPIRKLYDNGVRVTINTDDMLIFGQSVSEEFFNLYNAGVFTAAELDEIRQNGLSVVC